MGGTWKQTARCSGTSIVCAAVLLLLGSSRCQGSGFDGSGPFGASSWSVRKVVSRPAPAPTQHGMIVSRQMPSRREVAIESERLFLRLVHEGPYRIART